jgi:hypothetical protein
VAAVLRALFRLASAGALVAVAIHLAALLSPGFAAALYPPGYPAWRHAIFVAIDLAVAGLFVWRPPWFVWAFAALTLQVFYGHGRQALASWQRDGDIAWLDAAALVGAGLALVLLIAERGTRTTPLQHRET